MKKVLSTLVFASFIFASNIASAYMGVGKFVTLTPKDPVQGTIYIQPDGKGDHYLVFKGDFETVMAPDLRVILHKQIVPQDYSQKNALDLGPLSTLKGQQMYKLPRGIDIAKYQSIIVWCRQFNVTFGTAALIQLK